MTLKGIFKAIIPMFFIYDIVNSQKVNKITKTILLLRNMVLPLIINQFEFILLYIVIERTWKCTIKRFCSFSGRCSVYQDHKCIAPQLST